MELYDTDSVEENRLSTIRSFLRKRGFNNNSNPPKMDLINILHQQLHPNDRIEYLKLHGSVDWWRGDDNNIYHDFDGHNPLVRLIERNIVYPIYEKYVTREPFFTLYQYFRRSLLYEDIIVVVGYSFADFSINNAFIDWLIFNRNARLIVVARKQKHEYIRNIFGGLVNRIEFIEHYFGEQNFITTLENLLISTN